MSFVLRTVCAAKNLYIPHDFSLNGSFSQSKMYGFLNWIQRSAGLKFSFVFNAVAIWFEKLERAHYAA